MSDPFLWVRAYEDTAWGDGTRTVGWNTLYQGYDRNAALNSAQLAITYNEWVILDSQYPGNATWEPRVYLNKPYSTDVGGGLPSAAAPPAGADLPAAAAPSSSAGWWFAGIAAVASAAWWFFKGTKR